MTFKLELVASFKTKVRGVSRRQTQTLYCVEGDSLCFVREKENPADQNAIAVYRLEKGHREEQLGYLSRSLAKRYAPRIDGDWAVLQGKVLDLTGGREEKPIRGVNIEVSEFQKIPIS